MDKNCKEEIEMGSYWTLASAVSVTGTYTTVWDDGETVITSPCRINLVERTVAVDDRIREIESPYAEDEVDDNIENLDNQYVSFGDSKFPVVTEDSCNFEESGLLENRNGRRHLCWENLPFLLVS